MLQHVVSGMPKVDQWDEPEGSSGPSDGSLGPRVRQMDPWVSDADS